MVQDKLWYRKGCYIYIYYVRGDVGGRSHSSLRMTLTTSMPLDSRQILAVCTSVMLGPTCWRSAQNGGGGPYMLALGRTRWH